MNAALSIIEIPKNKQPDFPAAEIYLNDMGDEDMIRVVADVTGHCYFDFEDEWEQVQACRDRLYEAFETTNKAWNDQVNPDSPQDIMIYDGTNKMLVAVGNYDSCDLDSVESMELFKLSGMAKAAGFLEDTDDPPNMVKENTNDNGGFSLI